MIIIKGGARTDGAQLGRYLLSQGDNTSTTLIDITGMAGRNLANAMAMAQAAAEQTKGQKPFWHAQINPAEGVNLTREQQFMAVEVLERHLGLQGQPRVIVAHEKDGREHIHVAWSRYDADTGKLIRDDFSKRKNVAAAAEIAERLGLEPNRNPFEDRAQQRDDLTREDRRQQSQAKDSHAEQQQAKRAHKTRAERKAEISAMWHDTTTGQELRAALDAAGYTIARGWRGFVVVDEKGEAHSLARQIDGARAKDVRDRLADVDPGSILSAKEIKAAMRQARADRAREQAQGRAAEVADRIHAQAEAAAGLAQKPVSGGIGVAAPSPEATQRPSYEPETRPSGNQAAENPTSSAAGAAAADPEAKKPKTAADILADLTRNHSTFTRQDLARAVDKATGGGGKEPWMMQAGGLDAMEDDTKASAERSYADWAGRNPELAGTFGVARYVAYVQGQQAKRDAADPEAAQVRKDSKAAFDRLMSEVDASPDLIRLGPDQRGRERFTSRDMLDTEMRMQGAADELAHRSGHAVPDRIRDAVPGLDGLGEEQRAAFHHLTGAGNLALVVGFAGTGKSKMLGLAREAWEAAGFRVRGAALSGIAADSLENDAGIHSRTLHSLLHQLDSVEGREAEIRKIDQQLDELRSADGPMHGHTRANKRERAYLSAKRSSLAADLDAVRLTDRDVIVLDEAAMVGSGLMERILTEARQAGAKVVMTGDHEQLQAVDAGAAFRAMRDAHGAQEITEVRRQRDAWQRQATEAFGETRTGEALRAYRDAGMSHQADTRDQAKGDLITAWTEARQANPDASQIILAYTRKDVGELNELARGAYRAEGRLGDDHTLETAAGKQSFAAGDRMYFMKNDTRLHVKNGSLGSIEEIQGDRVTVALDSGRTVQFDVKDYNSISHGYAATVHKSQGVTVDRAHVLASRYMDRHAAYVGMTRHRDRADLYYGADEFKTWDSLEKRMSRDGSKDTTLDYLARAQAQGEASESLRAAVQDFHGRERPDTAAPSWTDRPAPASAQAPVSAPEPASPAEDRPMTRAERLAEIARQRREAEQPQQDRATQDRAEALDKRMSQEQRDKLDETRRQREAAEELRRVLSLTRGQRGPSL